MNLLNQVQIANQSQIKHAVVKKISQQNAQTIQEKLMIMKDIASQRIDDEDERERKILKEKYLKQNLDVQWAQALLSKRKDYILNNKELGMNHSIITNMNKGTYNSKDEVQEELILKSYIRPFL